MVWLSIFGAFVAGAHYYAIDLPEQKALSEGYPANANSDLLEKCDTCKWGCYYLATDSEKYQCLNDCELICV